MHRAPTPDPINTRLRRAAPYLVGGAVAALLFTVSASVRFAESGATDVAGAQLTTSVATTGTLPSQPGRSTVVPIIPSSVGTQPSTTSLATTSVAEDTGPGYGGSVTLGVVGERLSLNPLGLEGNTAPMAALAWAVTTGAIRLDPQTLEPEPLTVEDLPTTENGGLEITDSGELRVRYRIREDAVWADATPITVEDFIRTYDIARRAAGVHPDLRDRYDAIVPGSVTGSEREVEFRLRTPGIEWLALFDVLVPAHEVEVGDFSSAWVDTMWTAGGPFRFVAVDDERGRVQLAANERSWLTDETGSDPLPYLDGITVQYFATRDQLIEAIDSGKVDVGAVGGDVDTLTRFAADEQYLLDVRRGPAWEQIGFQFGPGRRQANPEALTDDVEVRRAIAAVIDRSELVTEIQGSFGRGLDSIAGISWEAAQAPVWGALDDLDPAEAAEFLRAVAEAAENPPVLAFATTATDPDREVVARHLVEVLEPLGFTVEVTRTETGAYFLDRVIPGAFEMAAWAWEARPGPQGAVQDLRDHHLVAWPQGTDFYNWQDGGTDTFALFQTIVTDASSQPDYAPLAGRLAEAEGLLSQDLVLIPLYAELNGAVAAARVGGFRHSILPGGVASSIAGWWTSD